jgi:GNAT superfamily N-acetyltransferase
VRVAVLVFEVEGWSLPTDVDEWHVREDIIGRLRARKGERMSEATPDVRIEPATPADIPTILQMIKALAQYEKLAADVVATEDGLRQALFGARRYAEVVFGCIGAKPVGFALFFHNFSTFRGAPGVYLEDLFVEPEWRRKGVGRKLLAHLAGVAVERRCHRLEWSVLDWNDSAIAFYRRAGARLLDDWRTFRLTGDALRALAETSPSSGDHDS